LLRLRAGAGRVLAQQTQSTSTGLDVRIIEADVTMTGADGSRTGDRYRLITTPTDHRRSPALALIRLYHERLEIESAYLALRHTLLGAHVLRSGNRPGLEQETWALLTLHRLLRTAMTELLNVSRWPAVTLDRTWPRVCIGSYAGDGVIGRSL
jgi:hypothetical protein